MKCQVMFATRGDGRGVFIIEDVAVKVGKEDGLPAGPLHPHGRMDLVRDKRRPNGHSTETTTVSRGTKPLLQDLLSEIALQNTSLQADASRIFISKEP